ncbi:MAG TPA: hypothetical protein PKL14_06130 [Holophaga sp.]|nr:hypothetical protein [Holophaga sp.]
MNERDLPVPDACRLALEAIQADPLDLPEEVERHLKTCLVCAETRIQWLAQEDAPHALAPAAYFERLPGRIQRKLPARNRLAQRMHPSFWAAAAGLALAVGIGGFMAGRVNRTPVVEAAIERPTPPPMPASVRESIPETPFHPGDEVTSQLSNLSQEEAAALAKRLAEKTAKPTEQPVETSDGSR